MKLESARIAALMQKENESILGYEDKICDLEARRESTARTIADAQKELQGELDLLKRIKSLLDERRPQYTIGRNTYSQAEVNADALQRLESAKRMQEGITFNESLLADLDTAIKQGRASLGEARKRLGELNTAMARLETRNVNADVRLEVAQLTNAIAGAPLSASSELEKAVRNYDRRVGQKERRAVTRLATSNGQFRIDYSAAMVTQDASTEIERLLNDGSAVEPVEKTPQTRPSAAEALQEEQS
jgi:orotate phosphoribosyltransferase-like protein